MYGFYCGLDLGQVQDYSALSVIEEPCWIDPPPELSPWAPSPALQESLLWQGGHRGWTPLAGLLPAQRQFFRDRNYSGLRPPGRPPLYVRHLKRWPLGTSYPAIIADVQVLLGTPPLSEVGTVLLVDHGGVGRGVVDVMWQAGLQPVGITITGGERVNIEAMTELKVPKRELAISAQVALQQGRLRIAPGLPEAAVLVKELAAYRVKISAAGHDSYAAREGAHDDLVCSVGMGVWYRDWFNQPHDDQIEERRRHGAREVPR